MDLCRLNHVSNGRVQYVQLCANVCVYVAIRYCHMNTHHVSHHTAPSCQFLFTLWTFILCVG